MNFCAYFSIRYSCCSNFNNTRYTFPSIFYLIQVIKDLTNPLFVSTMSIMVITYILIKWFLINCRVKVYPF